MLTGLFSVSVWSEDHARLVPFYRDVLGLAIMFEADGFAVFGLPEGGTILVGTHSDVHGPNSDPARHIIGLRTDDIEGDFGHLRDAGVTVVEAPREQGGGLMIATLADPEGNFFSLAQPARAG